MIIPIKAKKKTAKRPKVKLTKEEKDRQKKERIFKTAIKTIFVNAQFADIPARGKNIIINGREGDVDNLFVYENLIVLIEDTTTAAGDNLKAHVAKTASFFEHISDNKLAALTVLETEFPKFKELRNPSKYSPPDYHWVFIYAPLNRLDEKYESRHHILKFLRYSRLQYFLSLSKTIGKSVKFELYKFLGLALSDVGIHQPGRDKREYKALVLPESPSGFPDGHKIVSFLIEPAALLEQSYVLRRDGWRDVDCLYQRLLIKNKIIKMREYLASEKRVFVNNIIVTLPDDTKFLDDHENQIDPSKLSESQHVTVEFRRQLDSIGLVDGQHRVFAYHEGGDKADKSIQTLRDKQHLLVTGIVYPKNTDNAKRSQFEAKLFLEINDKQTRTKGDLKQTIQTIVDPFSDIAVAKSVMLKMAKTGPLCGQLEEFFYDQGKIKTTSIVSYGMKHIVGLDAKDSLIELWSNVEKPDLKKHHKTTLLKEYLDFCTSEINQFISGFKQNLDDDLWTTDLKKSRVLTTTTINGLVFCFRQLIQEGKVADFDAYRSHFNHLKIDFRPGSFKYRSSHWRELGSEMYKQCFAKAPETSVKTVT